MNRVYMTAALLMAVTLAGCGGGHVPQTVKAAPPVHVTTLEVRPSEWAVQYSAPGTVQAIRSTTLSSRIVGYVQEVRVSPGDRVSAGQVLSVIDSREIDANLQQARAAEQEAISGIPEAENGVAAAKAQLSLAEVTFKRIEDLFGKKSVSNQEFDEAKARLQAAQAAYRMALSRREQLDARVSRMKQGVEAASVMRSYAEVRAPFAGIVTAKQAEPGQMANPGTPLLTIEQAGGYRLEAPVEESLLGSIRVGQAVSVLLQDSEPAHRARVTEIVPAVDPASRSFLVKATLPALPNVRSGLYGKLVLSRSPRESLVIPADAVIRRGSVSMVLVAEDGYARSRMVSLGETRGKAVEVLSGLHSGDKIIWPRPEGLKDGARVEVRP